MRQPRLYISYSRADRTTAHKLADYLHRAYDEVWLDEHRYGGEVWWQELLWNLKACDIFVYLLSAMSAEAPYCQAELAEARRLRKQILPVLIQRQTPIPPNLEPYPVFDLTAGLNTPKVGELLAALKQLEARFPEAPLAPLDPKPTPVPLVADSVPHVPDTPRWPIATVVWVLVVLVVIGGLVFRSMSVPDPTATPTPVITVTPAAPTIPAVPSAVMIVLPPDPTPTGSVTSTATLSPTSTVTVTWTATPTRTPTATASDTGTPTGTPTDIAIITATSTASITDTPSATIPTNTSTSTIPPTVTRRAKTSTPVTRK